MLSWLYTSSSNILNVRVVLCAFFLLDETCHENGEKKERTTASSSTTVGRFPSRNYLNRFGAAPDINRIGNIRRVAVHTSTKKITRTKKRRQIIKIKPNKVESSQIVLFILVYCSPHYIFTVFKKNE